MAEDLEAFDSKREQKQNAEMEKVKQFLTEEEVKSEYYMEMTVTLQSAQAKRIFSLIPKGQEWVKAQYFLAVIQLQLIPRSHSLPEAIQLLRNAYRVISHNRTKQTKALHDIILLSLGRLYLEMKNFPDKASGMLMVRVGQT